MKTLFNITTSGDDYNRFETAADLDDLMRGFDGLELMYFGEDPRGHITPDRVTGLHMSFFYMFVDFWNGDIDAALRNFVTMDDLAAFYGGTDRDVIVKRFKDDVEVARRYGAEYLVFHVSEASIEESFTRTHRHTDDETVKATCEILNETLDEDDGDFALLLENLWQPGLSFLNPDAAWALLEGINHKNTGFMLDTGHLMHTSLDIRSQEEGLDYINKVLDNLGDELVAKIRGIHLNQSVTSDHMRKMMENPPEMAPTYQGRTWQMFEHVYKCDLHLPFTAEGVDELVRRIDPDWLTFEFITDGMETHRRYLAQQRRALGLD